MVHSSRPCCLEWLLTSAGRVPDTNVETVSCVGSLRNLEKTYYRLNRHQDTFSFQHLRVWYNKLDPRNTTELTTAKVQNANVEAHMAAEKNMPDAFACAVM